MIKLSVFKNDTTTLRRFGDADVSSHDSTHLLGPDLKRLITDCKKYPSPAARRDSFVLAGLFLFSFFFFFYNFFRSCRRSLVESVFGRGCGVLSRMCVLVITSRWGDRRVRRSQWWCSCSERSWSGCWKGFSAGVLPESLPCAGDPWNKQKRRMCE